VVFSRQIPVPQSCLYSVPKYFFLQEPTLAYWLGFDLVTLTPVERFQLVSVRVELALTSVTLR